MKTIGRRAVSFCLAIAMAFSMLSFGTVRASATTSKTKVNGYNDVSVVAQKSYTLVPGVTETDVIMNDATGDAQVMGYMTSISTDANVSLKATYTGFYDQYNASTGTSSWSVGDWGLSTTSKQAAAYEKADRKSVV